MILYHGTSYSSLLEITNDGVIIPQKSIGAGMGTGKEKDYLGKIFLSNKIGVALSYAVQKQSFLDGEEAHIVLEVDLPEELLQPDKCDYNPLARSWKRSLEEVYQVCISGSLDISYIRCVHFFSYESLQFGKDFECGFENWYIQWMNRIAEFEMA